MSHVTWRQWHMGMAFAARFTGYNNLKVDLQHLQMLTFRGLFEDKDSVSTKREVKLSKNLFLQFIIEIEVLECDCQSFHKN